jgi:cob(I)alamin adenosyltransferase
MKKDKMKEIIITVDKLPSSVLDQIGEIAEKNAELVCANNFVVLRNEIRKEITELKNELFKAGLVPSYRTAYMKYADFEDELISDKVTKMLDELSLKTGRSPRALRIRIKNIGLLGV